MALPRETGGNVPGAKAKAKPVVLRRTAVQPTVKGANNARSKQTLNRIVRNTPGLARVEAQGQQKAAAPQHHPNIIDHVLSDVGAGAKAVVKEAGKLGLAQEQMRQKQAPGIAEAGKQILAIHQHAAQEQAAGSPDQFVTGLAGAAKGTVEHPGKVLKATAKSIPGAVEGLVAGPAELLANPGGTLKGIRKDYGFRYGKDASKAVQQEGLLPYALDVATAAVPIGRATGAAAKVGAFGKVGEKVMADRPALRVTPKAVVQQEKSPNIFKAVGQTVQDTQREKATLKRQNKGTPRGIEPQGPNEVVPLSKRAADKNLGQSFGVRSGLNRNLHAQARQEIRRFFEKHVPKTLSKDQIGHGAFRYAVEHGIRTPEQAATYLPRLKALIQENRTKTPLHDELPHIQWLIDHPQVFDATLGKVADQASEMGRRLGAEDPRLKPKQQAVREATPQSLVMGTGARIKGERVTSFAKRVEAARQEAGLAKPGYFPHRDLVTPKFADYVRGTGIHGAVGGHKETNYTLMKEGAAVVHPQALSDALARNLKNQFNVNHVADTVASFAQTKLVDKTTGETIHLDPTKTTYNDLKIALEKSGVRDLVPYRPNTIYKKFRDAAQGDKNLPQDTVEAMQKGNHTKFLSDAYTMAKDPSQFHNSKGWVLIPKAIDAQMKDSLKHNGKVARLLTKNKSFNTKMILGLNPSWPMMRVGHNLGSAAVFDVNPLKAISAARDLSPEQLKTMDGWVGSDAFHFDKNPPRMGGSVSPDSKIAALRDIALSDTKTGKAVRAANPANWVHQLSRPAMAAERHQMAFFRRAAAYQKLSKDAKAKVASDVNGFIHSVSQARDELLKNPQYMEELAHHVNNIFGDFAHYQGLQRTAQQNIMFYGFLRYATRVVLKELPAKHPIKANILYNLSQQNERHTRDILGLGPNDPLPFGAEANVYSRDKSGNLSVQNFHRLNPFGAVSIVNAGNPRQVLTGSLPYAPAETLSQIANIDLLRRHGLRVDGKAAEKGFGDSIPVGDRARIALSDLLSQAAPYRILNTQVAGGRTMGNDSLAFSPRPIKHKQTQAITNDILAQKFGQKGGLLADFLKAEFPMAKIPSRDDVIALQIKQNQERLAGKHLTPQQKQAEEKRMRSQPDYAKAEQVARALSKQRSKRRGRHASTKPFNVDQVVGSGSNVIDSILP